MERTYRSRVVVLAEASGRKRPATIRERAAAAVAPKRVARFDRRRLAASLPDGPRYRVVLVEAVEAFDAVVRWADARVVVDLDDLVSSMMLLELKLQSQEVARRRLPSGHERSAARPREALERSFLWLRRLTALSIELLRWRRWEHQVARAADLVLLSNEADRGSFSRRAPVAVVPNGYEWSGARVGQPRGGGTPTVAFWGLMAYRPNADGARWFAKEVLPVLRELAPHVSVKIIGKGAESLGLAETPGIDVVGFVDDLPAALQGVDVAIVPLRLAGGTRIKILEAWAWGLPVVSTTTGAHGLGVETGRELLLADDPRRFAEAIHRVLEDGALRQTLIDTASERVATMTWEDAEKALVAALRGVVASARADDG